ncbi:MAG: hypothetical protein LCH81_15275 [Bacteroidetes bacterium]|nr:hypothetical protein [Bacteroidota bacterium]
MKRTIVIGVMLLTASHLFAQFLKINEIDQSGVVRPLTKVRQIVDLNSQISIELDKSTITATANSNLVADGSKRIDSLIDVLQLYKKYIETIQITIDRYEQLFQSPEQDLTELKTALKERAIAGDAIIKIFDNNSRFQRRREEELPSVKGKGSNERYRIIMRLLADEMQYADDGLQELRKKEGFYFQLAAWSVTKRGFEPIHLDGFDDLPPGEYYEYERNQLYLSEAQLKELDELTNFFENMDKSNTFEKLSGFLFDLLSKAVDVDGTSAQVKDAQALLKNLETTAKAQKDTIIVRLNTLAGKWNAFSQNLKTLKTKYSAEEGVSTANSKTDVLRGFENEVRGLKDSLAQISALAQNIIKLDEFKKLGDSAQKVAESIETIGDNLAKSAEKLVDQSRDAYQMAVYGRKINAEALEISTKVRKLGLDKIPNSTALDLMFTGKREPGDLIVLKAMLWKGSDKVPIKTETRDFPMMNALGHLQMSVVYAFAKPVPKDSNFKGGPLVSVLYKFKSHNLAYRNFVDVGIGLHAASYDFNNDDTPEFAGGIVTSIFKDYLQFGWGFNFNERLGYWFAGLRIPIPSSSISLLGQ